MIDIRDAPPADAAAAWKVLRRSIAELRGADRHDGPEISGGLAVQHDPRDRHVVDRKASQFGYLVDQGWCRRRSGYRGRPYPFELRVAGGEISGCQASIATDLLAEVISMKPTRSRFSVQP